MQAAFLHTLIKAGTTILGTFIWHSGHLRFVLLSVQEAASVIPVTEWAHLWAAIHDMKDGIINKSLATCKEVAAGGIAVNEPQAGSPAGEHCGCRR